MRIVFWGTYDTGKPRVRILLRGLCENGLSVTEVHRDVWGGIEDKSQVRGLAQKLGLLVRWLLAYPALIWRYLRQPRHDVVLVGYLGQLDVLILWPFARLRNVPVVWDAFLSLYNTVVEDRRLLSPCHPLARLLWAWEWLACRAVDCVVLDTRAHADYFVSTFGIAREKTAVAFVGAEPETFPNLTEQQTDSNVIPIVLFYGQFIPLHGIETIVHAARAMRYEPINWVIIGSGQEAERIRDLLDTDPLPRLRWIPWVQYAELTGWLSRATICLGIFGATDKAARVIPNKVFQILMSGKPLITRDSPAIRELIKPNQPGIWLVPPADPEALVGAIHLAIKTPVRTGLHASLRDNISPRGVSHELLCNISRMQAKNWLH